MTAMRLPGPLGSVFNRPGLDAGTRALMAAPRPRPVGVASAPTGQPTLRNGDDHPLVRRLQKLLNERLRPSPALALDAAFGLDTEMALRRFQQACGLRADGIAGRRTWAALESEPHAAASAPVVGDGTWASLDADYPEAPWMAVARTEIGQAEIGGSRHNPRIVAYHASTSAGEAADETPWCSSFVNWVLREAGYGGTGHPGAASWLRWGEPCSALAGAITVIHNPAMKNTSLSRSGNHVGFLVRDLENAFVLLGGNQGNRVGVARFRKPAWTLKAYRWPGA